MFNRTYIYETTLNEDPIIYTYILYFDRIFKKCSIFVNHSQYSTKEFEYINDLKIINQWGEDFIINENKIINDIKLCIDEINNNFNNK